ncbi:aspartate aminotransferase family protein [Pseudomonas sp. ES3-33]|jgi:putrescine aminotransferase|uniref:aspartate aminotransferase family protein n=1 Tax=Pseudomonas sp. ES3-33 TaxID=1628833 RepID=UPI0005D41FED|nr:aspartate aminotransferase family protein [Pseudomonas sp. ES3-33]KJH76895.1 aminotransferase [Pseudomonas sp. ES3-33]
MNKTVHNPKTLEWQVLSDKHHLAPFSDYKQLKQTGPRIITRADGVYLWDSEGNKILDAMAGLWCVAIGYGRDELAKAASHQMNVLPYYNTFFMTAHPPVLELAKVIAELAPAHMNHVFFTGSGSEANDTMVRMVRHYWAVKGQPEKKVIIGRLNGYHGSTVAGASLGGMKAMHDQGGMIPDIVHIAQPYWFGEGGDMSPDEFGTWAADQLEKKILKIGIDNVAAFVAEPIQGAGGVIIAPDTYWPRIREILAKYDILFTADEVVCGFGRTGEWFGSDYYGISPDFMTIAKGLTSGYIPMGGLIVSDKVAEVLNEGGDFYHGFTYSGHPVSAAVALENIRIIREEKILERVREETAPYLQKRLRELEDHPLVGEIRGLGMLGAIELVKNKHTRERFESNGVGMICRNHCFNNGLIMRAVGETMVIAPPLVISKSEIDELIAKARLCLDLTYEEVLDRIKIKD